MRFRAFLMFGLLASLFILIAAGHASPPRRLRTNRVASDLKQGKGVATKCIDEKRHAIVLSAVGRSGSTFVMDMIGAVRGTFVIPEPFKYWSVRRHKFERAPTYEQLLNCSYLLDADLAQKVVWSYACMNMPSIKAAGGNPKHVCRKPLQDGLRRKLHAMCTKACIRIIKTIRYPQHPLDTRQIDALKTVHKLSVVQLVRNPFDITLSQWRIGWTVKGTGLKPNSFTHDMFVERLVKSCRVLAAEAKSITESVVAKTARVAVIEFEEFKRNVPLQLLRILDNPSMFPPLLHSEIQGIASSLVRQSFGPSSNHVPLPSQVSMKQALADAAAASECQALADSLFPDVSAADLANATLGRLDRST